MTDPVRRGTWVLSLAALLGALAFAVPASAGAATVQSYTCADSAQSGATSASLSLTSPPASATAGQSLTLQAHLTLTLPQSFGLLATADLISQVGLSTTNFGLEVQIGTTVVVVPAAIVVGQLQTVTVGASEVASASLTFPAVTVPRTATGDVVISMPTAAQYPNSATSTPAEVVFNGVLEEQTYTDTPSSANLACYDASGSTPASQVIAQVPIQAATATAKATTPTKTTASTTPKTTTTAKQSKTTPSSSAKSTHHSPKSAPAGVATAAPTGQSATAAPVTGTPTASSAPAAAATAAPSTNSASAPASASSSSETTAPAATEASTDVTIPPRTAGKGTFIPTWELILMGSLLPIAALGYAWHRRRMLAAARTALEHRHQSALLHPDGSDPREAELVASGHTPSPTPRESQTRT